MDTTKLAVQERSNLIKQLFPGITLPDQGAGSIAAAVGAYVAPGVPAAPIATPLVNGLQSHIARGSVVDFVLDCGADPTGVADVAPAWEAARTLLQSLATNTLAPKQSLTLFFPPGVYNWASAQITDPWVFSGTTTSVRFLGSGIDSSVFVVPATTINGMRLTGLFNFTISDVTFYGLGDSVAASNVSNVLFFVDIGRGGTLERVKFCNLKSNNYIFWAYNSSGSSGAGRWAFRDVVFEGCASALAGGGILQLTNVPAYLLERVTFIDLGGVNLGNTFGKSGPFNWFVVEAPANTLSQGTLRTCFFDEAAQISVQVDGNSVVGSQLRMEQCYFNPSTTGGTACLKASHLDLVEVDGLINSGFHLASTAATIALASVASAHLRGVAVNNSASSNYISADAACGYVEVEDSPTLLVPNVRSAAARTVVKTQGSAEDVFIANATIAAYQLVKNVTGGVIPILTTDPIDVVAGPAGSAAIATQSVSISRAGTPTKFLSDGTATIAIGDNLIVSPTIAGRVRTGAASGVDRVGRSNATVAATVDALVEGVFQPFKS